MFVCICNICVYMYIYTEVSKQHRFETSNVPKKSFSFDVYNRVKFTALKLYQIEMKLHLFIFCGYLLI